MRCLLVRGGGGGVIGEPGASNTNLKSSGGVYLKGLCHDSPVHFVYFFQLLAFNRYGT